MTEQSEIYATAVSISGNGILLTGNSKSGKSDLAIRLIAEGATLIADDRTIIKKENEILFAASNPAIKGIIEVRGIGLIHTASVENVPIKAVFNMIHTQEERMPEPSFFEIMGIKLPFFKINPFFASATVKVKLALNMSL